MANRSGQVCYEYRNTDEDKDIQMGLKVSLIINLTWLSVANISNFGGQKVLVGGYICSKCTI